MTDYVFDTEPLIGSLTVPNRVEAYREQKPTHVPKPVFPPSSCRAVYARMYR